MKNSKELINYKSLLQRVLKKSQETKNDAFLKKFISGTIYFLLLVKKRQSLISVRKLRLNHDIEILTKHSSYIK